MTCPDNHACFYQLENFGQPLESHVETGACRNFSIIPVAKSAHNWTGTAVEVFDGRDCSGNSFTIQPDEDYRSFPIPAGRSFRFLS